MEVFCGCYMFFFEIFCCWKVESGILLVYDCWLVKGCILNKFILVFVVENGCF